MRQLPGPLLVVDLDSREAWPEDVTTPERFVGGRGVATKLAHDRIPFDADPLGPANRLFFSIGPLQASTTSFTGRTSLTGVSPLTDGLLSSNAGGYLSRHILETGFCAVEVRGRADELVAVHVSDTGVEFEDVPGLENGLVPVVSREMDDRHGLGADHLATIGPAGEHLVRFANVMTYDHRAFGRGGLGAVLGSKNVKTISFAGDSAPSLDFPAAVLDAVDEEAATTDDAKRTQGTPNGVRTLNENHSLPTRYFHEQSFADADRIDGETWADRKHEQGTCSQCGFACKLPTRDEATGFETEGPEYEAVFALGSNVGVGDPLDLMESNDRCDELGLDVISTGDVIAAYLAAHDRFGDATLVHDLVEQIAYRQGVGDGLADGLHAVAEGLGVADWTVKGLGFPGHDPRVLPAQSLSYAVANRGADHLYASVLDYGAAFEDVPPEDAATRVVQEENRRAVEDSAIACTFGGGHVTDTQLAALLDEPYSRLSRIGARVVELERHFNNQRGVDRADDTLPEVVDRPGLADAIDAYYDERDWNPDGTVPTSLVR